MSLLGIQALAGFIAVSSAGESSDGAKKIRRRPCAEVSGPGPDVPDGAENQQVVAGDGSDLSAYRELSTIFTC